LQKDPELVDHISALFLMGSNYGGGPNDVDGWQMTYNRVTSSSSCAEDATGHYYVSDDSQRHGCRGNSMSDSGDTEWNLFLDALAWHVATRFVADSVTKPPIYVITSGATEATNVTLTEFEAGSKYLHSKGAESISSFTQSLGTDFLKAGEAKWWDAQLGTSKFGLSLLCPAVLPHPLLSLRHTFTHKITSTSTTYSITSCCNGQHHQWTHWKQ